MDHRSRPKNVVIGYALCEEGVTGFKRGEFYELFCYLDEERVIVKDDSGELVLTKTKYFTIKTKAALLAKELEKAIAAMYPNESPEEEEIHRQQFSNILILLEKKIKVGIEEERSK